VNDPRVTGPEAATPLAARRKRQRDGTEASILAAAVAVFSERGYAAATVADIVQGCGISRGAFYLYFQDKKDVFRELVRRAVADCYDVVPVEDGTLRERIRRSTRLHLEAYQRNRGILRCLFEVSTVEPEFGDLHNRYRTEFVERIERHLYRAGKAGRCRPLDPKVTAFSLGCMIGGVAYMWLCADFDPYGGSVLTLDSVVEQITEFWVTTVYRDGVA
jgi:AcrR family transcriptional regulator